MMTGHDIYEAPAVEFCAMQPDSLTCDSWYGAKGRAGDSFEENDNGSW